MVPDVDTEKKTNGQALPQTGTAPAGHKSPRRLRMHLYAGMRLNTALFFLILGAGCIVSFILPLRPTVSAVEKRKLTQFPAFSVKAFLSGDYFDGITTWYADTFPGREKFISLNNAVREVYVTKQTVQVHGTVESGDKIPDAPSKPASSSAPSSSSASSSSVPPSSSASSSSSAAASSSGSAAGSSGAAGSSSASSSEAVPPHIAATGDTQSFSAVLLAGNAAYEYYNFDQEAADLYVGAVSATADGLAGVSSVYALVPPTSMGITLPDDLMATVNSEDQQKALSYLMGSMSANVKTVDAYSALMQHRDEYVYFRTDHHWTALGAYYAYGVFCSAAGLTPAKLTDFREMTFPGFLGSFYSSTNESSALASDPDTVTAYKPEGASMTITDRSGQTFSWPVVSDVSDVSASLKYGTFIGGDNPYSVITNPALPAEKSAVVVKESFGNAFVPFLVKNYGTVYVIDYRYWSGSVTAFAKENAVKDVLFINNISATRSSTLMGYLSGVS